MSRASRKKSKRSLNDRWRYGFEIGLIGLLVVLFFNLLAWPIVPIDQGLDGSWQAVLTYAQQQGLHFGDDIIFTYGPLGNLSSFSYSGYNHAGKYAFELFVRLAVIVFLYRFLLNLRPFVKLGCLLLYLFILQFLPDVYETYFFFGMLSWAAALLLEQSRKNRKPLALLSVGVAYLAVASLIKFTLLIAAVFCLGLVVVYLWVQARRTEAIGVLGGYVLGVLALWSMLGQRIGDIPAFLYGSYQVAKGYAMSMQVPMEDGVLKYFLLLLLSSVALVAIVLIEHLRGKRKHNRLKQAWAPLVFLYTGFFFMVWKQGVVRSDGHIWQFICYVPLAAWFVYPVVKKRSSQLMLGALSIIQFLLMLSAMTAFYPGFLLEVPGRVWNHTASGLDGFLNPSSSMNGHREALAQKASTLINQYDLLNSVTDQSVDVVGDQQGLAILTGLRYQPRPVFQNYVANNAYLQGLNARYWEAGNTPDQVIQSLNGIDGTMPTQSDSQTLLHLLSHYRHRETSGIYVLLSKRESPVSATLGNSETLKLELGETLPLTATSSGVHLAKFDVSLNILGRLRAFLFKPPILYLKTELSDGSSFRHRFNPVTVERNFLLAPSLQSADHLWRFRSGASLPEVTSLTIECEPRVSVYFKANASVTLTPVSWKDIP